VEPSLRFAPFKSNFYLYGGPRLAFNLDKSFTYQLGINPAYIQEATPAVKVILIKSKNNYFNANGAGYDIPLSTDANKTQFVLSPLFLSNLILVKIHSTETWNNTTVEQVALKFGQGKTFKKLLI
jgi:hypothetical protein